MMGRLNHDQGEFFYSFRLDEATCVDRALATKHYRAALACAARSVSGLRERDLMLFEARAPEWAAVLAAPKLYPGVTPKNLPPKREGPGKHKGAGNGLSSLPAANCRSSIVASWIGR